MLPTALLRAQLAIYNYTINPCVTSLVQLHESLRVATSLLPPVPAPAVDIPVQRTTAVPKFYGDVWKTVDLDRFYARIFQTCTITPVAQSVLVRLHTTNYVFTEVILGRILYPLQTYFETVFGSFEHAYINVVERIFLYFTANEGKAYSAEDAFRAVRLATGNVQDSIYLISVLEQYDPTRFRNSSHRGVIHIMFSPSATRSARDLTRDYFIERFRAVKSAMTKKVVQTKPTGPERCATPSKMGACTHAGAAAAPAGLLVCGPLRDPLEDVPDVVHGVLTNIFG